MKTKAIKWTVFCILCAVMYALGRLYFHLTGGFTIGNITSDFAYRSDLDIRPLTTMEQQQLDQALNQSYHYLGKGCQSYVFLSEDKNYVIKFFKYQRFRLQPWLEYFPPLPAIVKYKEEKKEKKQQKLDYFFKSWKVAFENLKEETGLLYVHLNKTDHLQRVLIIYDKLGRSHQVNLDQLEFCVQGRAEMLCSKLMQFREKQEHSKARLLLQNLLTLILSEYHRGFADNDHALMQNTGVVNEKPIHIDVGQFVQNEEIKNPSMYKQELFTKMYKFKLWVKESYPELFDYLEEQLHLIIGPQYDKMKPKFREKH